MCDTYAVTLMMINATRSVGCTLFSVLTPLPTTVCHSTTPSRSRIWWWVLCFLQVWSITLVPGKRIRSVPVIHFLKRGNEIHFTRFEAHPICAGAKLRLAVGVHWPRWISVNYTQVTVHHCLLVLRTPSINGDDPSEWIFWLRPWICVPLFLCILTLEIPRNSSRSR